MEAFVRQIAVAKKYNLPVNVHSRYAGHYCIDVLIEQGVTKALLHAYDGNLKSVKKALAAGFYFSIPASVRDDATFQRLAKNEPFFLKHGFQEKNHRKFHSNNVDNKIRAKPHQPLY